MLKVLIVDDEVLVRLGMVSMVPWEECGFQVIGDVGDGHQALQAIRREEPDIVLTDIVMPGLDGIGLIRKLRQQYAHIQIIVLSSHHDFEYVREAMKLGACDYVLKTSLKPGDFIHVLQQAAERIRQEQARSAQPLSASDAAERRKYALLSLLTDSAENQETKDDSGTIGTDAADVWEKYREFKRILYLRSHHLQDHADGKTVERTLYHVFTQQMKEAESSFSEAGCEVHGYKESEWFVLVDSQAAPVTELSIQRLARRLIKAADRYANAAVSVGVSEPFVASSEFAEAFRQAREAMRCSFYRGIGGCYVYQRREPGIVMFTTDEQRAVAEYVQFVDREALLGWLEAYYERIAAVQPQVEQVKALYLEIVHLIKQECESLQLDWAQVYRDQPFHIHLLQMETLTQIRDWMHRFALGVMEQLEEQRKHAYRDEIRRLTDYLKRNYMRPISLREAAGIANMSESHLSYIFKKETGKSFVEFMTSLRIEKAVELLRTTSLTNAEIARQVGYDNINYFGRAFKKVTGFSPTRYKEIVKK